MAKKCNYVWEGLKNMKILIKKKISAKYQISRCETYISLTLPYVYSSDVVLDGKSVKYICAYVNR